MIYSELPSDSDCSSLYMKMKKKPPPAAQPITPYVFTLAETTGAGVGDGPTVGFTVGVRTGEIILSDGELS